MKKNLKLTLSIISLLGLATSCEPKNEEVSATLIAPNGTPLLAISNYLHERPLIEETVVEGSTPLLAAFTSKQYDMILAPINLGAQIYNKGGEYKLFETVVWGNLYVASRNEIKSFTDLSGKNVTLFGTNQTPDIIMKCLSTYYNINYEVTRVDEVSTANASLLQNKAEYIVSAEPSLSKLKEKIPNLYTLDLQEEWKKFSTLSSYPQAGIFVRSDSVDRLKGELSYLKNSIKNILKDTSYTVSCALEQEKLNTLGEATLTSSLPNCHIGIEENQKGAIEFYFNKLNEIGLSAQYGGKLPGEDFYLTI